MLNIMNYIYILYLNSDRLAYYYMLYESPLRINISYYHRRYIVPWLLHIILCFLNIRGAI